MVVIIILNVNFLFIINLLIYLFVFIFPIILYLKLVNRVNPLEYLKLTSNIKQGLVKGFIISIVFISLLIIKRIMLGGVNINLNIGILWISGITVGILE